MKIGGFVKISVSKRFFDLTEKARIRVRILGNFNTQVLYTLPQSIIPSRLRSRLHGFHGLDLIAVIGDKMLEQFRLPANQGTFLEGFKVQLL